jgi:hypothetical protein
MASSDLFLKVFSLAEYHGQQSFSFDIQQCQYRLLQKLADNMNEHRASDVIRSTNSPLSKLLKNLHLHNSRFQPIMTNLILKIVHAGRRSLDVKSLFALIL